MRGRTPILGKVATWACFGCLAVVLWVSSSLALTINFEWDPPDPNVPPLPDGYRIYMTETPGVYSYGSGNAKYQGPASIFGGTVVTDIPPDGKRYFVATAYLNTGIESDPSNEVMVQAPAVPCVYTYSTWGECQPSGTQTRTVLTALPAGCSGTPILSQSCTYVPVPFNSILRTAWVLKAVDSEETVEEQSQAIKAFDGNPATIWHTKYSGTPDPQPHFIQIDLGAVYDIDGLKYLPRQDIDDGIPSLSGTITAWEFSVSVDGVSWVQAGGGTWAADQTEKQSMFAVKRGRYVMLKSSAVAGGSQWTSCAELFVSGVAVQVPQLPPGKVTRLRVIP